MYFDVHQFNQVSSMMNWRHAPRLCTICVNIWVSIMITLNWQSYTGKCFLFFHLVTSPRKTSTQRVAWRGANSFPGSFLCLESLRPWEQGWIGDVSLCILSRFVPSQIVWFSRGKHLDLFLTLTVNIYRRIRGKLLCPVNTFLYALTKYMY